MRQRLFLPLLILAAGLACGIPFALQASPTAPASDSPVPGATPSATASPTVQLPSPKPLPVGSSRYFKDEFDSFDSADWKTFVTSGEAGLLDQRVENGSLVFDFGGVNIDAFMLYRSERYKDVRLDVRVAGRNQAAYRVSLLCRYDEKAGWYQVDVFNTGLFNFFYYSWNEDKHPVAVPLADGDSDAMGVGGSNDLTLVCNDRNISLFVNSVEAHTISESIYFLSEGQVGIGASSFTKVPVVVAFDWLMVSIP